ncbi:Tim44 domain-containing protein [Massilia sp. HP4]|uniref:Tim44 domain-containing protein n=1 Tax=Massilia sp. HP4 TaxID=2562316 RepID=UPI0010BF71FF|nr:Tim44-like domain-containing protein [Massilia sp. HP4]
MKKFLVTTMLAVTAFAMVADAFARPMGGKRSMGRQSQSVQQQGPAPAPAQSMQRQTPNSAAPAAAGAGAAGAAAAAKKPSMMRNILGGALLGLGLGMLLSHLGIGGALASAISAILMIALIGGVIFFIVRMLRRKDTPANPSAATFGAGSGFKPQPAGAGATPEIGSGLRNGPSAFQGNVALDKGGAAGFGGAAAAPAYQQWGVPSDFDSETFLRHAKSSFIRMQAAWDRGDTDDLREFTAPEVFAELKMQIQERGGVADYTDVVNIDAQLLGIEKTATDYLASVQFNAMIRSAKDALPEPFVEVWNMSKPLSGSGGWVLAGIQQTN